MGDANAIAMLPKFWNSRNSRSTARAIL